jgi:hypothetical protein
MRGLKIAGDAFKTTLNLLANACDGAPFPLKAMPQTILLVIKQFEVPLFTSDVLGLTGYSAGRAKRTSTGE